MHFGTSPEPHPPATELSCSSVSSIPSSFASAIISSGVSASRTRFFASSERLSYRFPQRHALPPRNDVSASSDCITCPTCPSPTCRCAFSRGFKDLVEQLRRHASEPIMNCCLHIMRLRKERGKTRVRTSIQESPGATRRAAQAACRPAAAGTGLRCRAGLDAAPGKDDQADAGSGCLFLPGDSKGGTRYGASSAALRLP